MKYKTLWMVAAIVTMLSQSALAATNYTTGVANLRASSGGKITGKVADDTPVIILETKGEYKEVQLPDGRVGWIHRNLLTSSKTEADNCGTKCLNPQLNKTISEAAENIKNATRLAQGPQCVAKKIIASGMELWKEKYKRRTKGKGACLEAVRTALGNAGIYRGGPLTNSAKDSVPRLKAMGFVNIKTKGMTPMTAPNGAILVYGSATRKGCAGLGSVHGHIEIKENNDSYIYDGKVDRSIQEAFDDHKRTEAQGQCRPLIAVLKMGPTCKTCKPEIKRTCGV